jgi:hypothetical protein
MRIFKGRVAGKINYRGSSDEDEKACLQQRTLDQTVSCHIPNLDIVKIL